MNMLPAANLQVTTSILVHSLVIRSLLCSLVSLQAEPSRSSFDVVIFPVVYV